MSNAQTRMARYKRLRTRQGPYWQRERSRNGYAYAWMVIMLGLLLIGVGLLTMGCTPEKGHPRRGGTVASVYAWTPAGMAACATEDGGGPGQGYPCFWRCDTMGNRLCAPDGTHRVLIFGDASGCPWLLPYGWICEDTAE